MMDGLRFHHLGVACRNLDRELRAFQVLGYEMLGEVFSDPIQGIRGCFLRGCGPDLELLAPLHDSSPLKPWLDRGVKIYHHAYEVDSLRDAMERLVAQGAIMMSPPKQAAAFSGREIAFVMLSNTFLIELIQAGQNNGY
jgi:methylmalonyl-CoA/ethylmalonyl-CoA epimerase